MGSCGGAWRSAEPAGVEAATIRDTRGATGKPTADRTRASTDRRMSPPRPHGPTAALDPDPGVIDAPAGPDRRRSGEPMPAGHRRTAVGPNINGRSPDLSVGDVFATATRPGKPAGSADPGAALPTGRAAPSDPSPVGRAREVR